MNAIGSAFLDELNLLLGHLKIATSATMKSIQPGSPESKALRKELLRAGVKMAPLPGRAEHFSHMVRSFVGGLTGKKRSRPEMSVSKPKSEPPKAALSELLGKSKLSDIPSLSI